MCRRLSRACRTAPHFRSWKQVCHVRLHVPLLRRLHVGVPGPHGKQVIRHCVGREVRQARRASIVQAGPPRPVGAAPAVAYQTATLSGTGQARVYENYGTANDAYVGAWDDAADQNPVYATYYRSASSGTERNLWNKGGGGTLTFSGNGSWVIKAKICESQVAEPDDCSVFVAMDH
jgi:hypothetical protein